MLNRQKVRNLLSEYKEAERQKQGILKDREIQILYKNGDIDKARRLVEQKYRKGTNEEVNKAGIALIKEMTQGVPEFRGVASEDIWLRVGTAEKIIKLAERV